jgi:hypothetical protein
METIHAVFIMSETLYAEPNRREPPVFMSLRDALIGAAVLFGTVGCVIIFRILYRKWKSRIYRRNPSDLLPTQKKNLTEYEKRILAEKINESRKGNIKKSFASTVSTKGMIFGTIILIALTLLFVVGMILMKFQKY